MDRCALFVDAGYVLADGALAVHGTRQRGSVSWDYAGLVKLLTGLSRDRTGLPVLRCYWYEAVEGRRNAEHETLADLPGLKLRLGNRGSHRRFDRRNFGQLVQRLTAKDLINALGGAFHRRAIEDYL